MICETLIESLDLNRSDIRCIDDSLPLIERLNLLSGAGGDADFPDDFGL